MAIHNDIGHIGEQCAVELLEKKGFKILERNWRLRHLEIDIIAANKNEIVFVEVKTRTSMLGGSPEEAVDIVKRKRMIAAANAYIKYKREERTLRFDIIGILINSSGEITNISHLEHAFIPTMRTIGQGSYSGRYKWSHRSKVISR